MGTCRQTTQFGKLKAESKRGASQKKKKSGGWRGGPAWSDFETDISDDDGMRWVALALTRTRRIRHLIHAPYSRTSAVCSGCGRCLFLLLFPVPLLDEVRELPRLLDCWGNSGGEGGYEDGGDEADEGEREE